MDTLLPESTLLLPNVLGVGPERLRARPPEGLRVILLTLQRK